MIKYISESRLIIVAAIMLLMISCTPGSCFEETESYVKASFYDNVSKTLHAPDSLTLYGLSNDSMIYNKTTSVQPALIPLNSSTESCTFVIDINGASDTVEFQYNSFPHLILKECGYTYYHHLDSVLFKNHAIKGIYISNKTITNLNVENIRIFY